MRLGGPARAVIVVAILQALAVGAYLYVEHRRQGGRAPPMRYEVLGEGRRAPDLDLERSDGTPIRLAQLRGRRVLLHFWATWCEPCREEIPSLLEGAAECGLEGVAVTAEPWSVVRTFFGGAVPPHVFRDPSGQAAERYEVSTLPDSYLLDRGGTLRVRFGGPRDWRSKAAQDVLRGVATAR